MLKIEVDDFDGVFDEDIDIEMRKRA